MNRNGKFKRLGIKFDFQKHYFFEENIVEKLTAITKLLNDWSFRDISIIGKITVIKSLALPILVQSLSVLPNSQREVSDIQSLFFKFIWSDKPDKVKRNLLVQSYENGGLKMPHIQSFESALKMTWIKKIINPEYSAPWKTLILSNFDALGGDKFWLLNTEGLLQVKSRKYQGVFEVKSRVKTWQVRGIWSQQLEH